MKVLIISHMYPSTFNEVWGLFVHQQVQELQKQGCEVQVVSPVPWTPLPIKYLSKKWKRYSGIPIKMTWDGIDVWYPRYLSFPKNLFFASSGQRMYRGIKNAVAKIYQEFRFDLIHAHVALPDGYVGVLLAEEYHKPLIVTIHGQDFQQTIYQNATCRQVVFYVLKAASKSICVSRKLQQISVKHFGIHDKLIVIPNGIKPQDVLSPPVEYNKQKGKYLTLLSVSNLVQTKGIDLNLYALQRICKRYSALRYLIIGGGPEEENLQKLAKKLGLEKQVEFFGRQPHDRVMGYMATCDIFTLPSWNEGFGIVYLEAMANGKPVIGCQGEGIEDFVEHGKTGLLVKPQDVDNLVEALAFLLDHPQEVKSMVKSARRLVLENYTWEKNAEKTIKIYKEVLNVH